VPGSCAPRVETTSRGSCADCTDAPCLAARSRPITIFQNPDDRELFVINGLTQRARTAHIPGCGVDVKALKPNFARDQAHTFVMASRMLWSKGVREFVEAARRVKVKHPEARFLLLGGAREHYDSKNRDFVPAETLNAYAREGFVECAARFRP
jgi:glycosyltransferase involved in cell wall biosynthesis